MTAKSTMKITKISIALKLPAIWYHIQAQTSVSFLALDTWLQNETGL